MSNPAQPKCQIKMFFHCATCLPNKPDGVSPAEWSSLQAGWTDIGMEIWCKRCNKSVAHFTLAGTAAVITQFVPPPLTGNITTTTE